VRVERDFAFDDPETQLADCLDHIIGFLKRFVVFVTEAQVIAVALWVIHTWAFEAAHATGYLAISSAERESGKSRLLEVLELLVRRPWYIVRPSEAVLFRTIEKKCPTILLDEYDTVFGRSNDYEGVRSVLNAGHRPGASVPRVVGEGKKMDVRDFPVYCPKALAGIRELPDTVRSRAIHIRLQRRRRSEKVEKFRRRFVEPDAIALATRIEKWALENVETLNALTPQIPDELGDRAADCWEPLLAIAEVAGSDWGQRARAAAVTIAGAATTDDTRGTLPAKAPSRSLRAGGTPTHRSHSPFPRRAPGWPLGRVVRRAGGPW
jgi:hypothetical protein